MNLPPLSDRYAPRSRQRPGRLRTSHLRLLGAALLAFALSCYAAATNPPLVLGSYGYPGIDRQDAMRPLARLVATTTGLPVEIRLYPSPDRLAAAVSAGDVDVAVANLGAWLSLAGDPAVQPLASVTPPASVQGRYRAVLLARRDLPASGLAEIAAGAGSWRLAAVMPGSASGGLVQGHALAQASRGAPQWLSVSYFGSHEAALAALANGMADLAAVADAPWLAWQAGQAEGGWRPRVVWQSPPLPSGIVACRVSPRIDCTALARTLVQTTPQTRRAALSLGRGWPEWARARAFAPYDHAPYASLLSRNGTHSEQ